jgi:ketosteroid isomerase-like protein
MSLENVEIVRAMWKPFEGLDVTEIDWDSEAIREVMRAYSPDVELRWSARWAGEREYSGRGGVIQAYREWVEPFSEYQAEALDFIEVGDNVVVPTRQWGVGRTSGAPVETKVTHVFKFRDGLIVRMDEYENLEEGLAAAERGK